LKYTHQWRHRVDEDKGWLHGSVLHLRLGCKTLQLSSR
jgi:hypothetical protein